MLCLGALSGHHPHRGIRKTFKWSFWFARISRAKSFGIRFSYNFFSSVEQAPVQFPFSAARIDRIASSYRSGNRPIKEPNEEPKMNVFHRPPAYISFRACGTSGPSTNSYTPAAVLIASYQGTMYPSLSCGPSGAAPNKYTGLGSRAIHSIISPSERVNTSSSPTTWSEGRNRTGVSSERRLSRCISANNIS